MATQWNILIYITLTKPSAILSIILEGKPKRIQRNICKPPEI